MRAARRGALGAKAMITISVQSAGRKLAGILGGIAAISLLGCSGVAPGMSEESVGQATEALTEDGIAQAYALFKQQFVTQLAFDQNYPIAYGYHPGLSTEKLVTAGQTAVGRATIVFAEGRVKATLDDVPANQNFDLWFVKNVPGAGRTVKPETGDQFLKVGSFTGVDQFGGKSLDVVIGNGPNGVDFDLDLVVVTRAGQSPTASRVLVGSRTLLEKRFFRERNGQSLDPVSGSLSNQVETNDPRVQRGAFLFANETFGGNGRTCTTCHRIEHNLTIDPAFIANLPASDPLFVAETNPALAGLENPQLLRTRALIAENADGFDAPVVFRSVPHTQALSATQGIENATRDFPQSPPDHRLGWGGDGAPGRGTLNEFAFGAIVQHLTKDLRRRVGTDFRIPTQEELDAIEAFELFSGRQKLVDGRVLALRDAGAEHGRTLFMTTGSGGKCVNCHLDLGSIDNQNPPLAINFIVAQGVRALTPDLPPDDGFLKPNPAIPVLLGDGSFNVPPLIEAADTMGAFHNNAALDLESAISFYASDTFRATPVGASVDIHMTPADIANIGAFLRVMNAGENIAQIRKRIQYVHDNRSAGNTSILNIAINDTQDALNDLSQKSLNPAAQNELATVKQTLIIANANPDASRPAYLDSALVYLGLAKADLFTANPNDEF
ncbi:MAG TPA: hypothetical protein VHV51_03455 [Polyangiaceae bacterium]|nr:hypothetical protein [Polyangiaceae bacterium]